MFEKHFQLQRRPFPSVPTPDRYFAASTIENARLSLIRLVERDEGPGLVIGAAGTGKTMLCHILEESLHDQCRVVRLPSGRLRERRALLQSILYELGLPYRDLDEGELRLALIDHVTDQEACPGGILILVDEAESLALALLDELRTMTNLTSAGQACVKLILLGNRRLEEKFADPRMNSFGQRIAGRFYLESYNRDETRRYIEHQIHESGGNVQMVLSEDTFDTIYQATEGVPRLINQLCDHAMILCTINDVRQMSAADVEEAWTDLQQLPVPRAPFQDASTTTMPDIVEFGQLDSDAVAESVEATIETIERQLPKDLPQEPPEVELILHDDRLRDDPFGDSFEEELVVIDQYATPDSLSNRHLRQVVCQESHKIACQLDEVLRQIHQATSPSQSSEDTREDTSSDLAEDEPNIVTFSAPAADPVEMSDDLEQSPERQDEESIELRLELNPDETLDDAIELQPDDQTAVETADDSLAVGVISSSVTETQQSESHATPANAVESATEDDAVVDEPSPAPSPAKKTYRNLFTRLQQRD